MRDVLVFDVNETLLDLRELRPHFKETFGDERVTAEWFGLMLRLSLVATITRTFAPFDVLGRAALDTTAEKYGLSLDSAVMDGIINQFLTLPPHPDVIPALERLRGAGYRTAVLTNSATAALASQMAHAGLTDYFEKRLSVEAVQLFKPAPEVYQYAARQLDIPLSQMRLVSVHDWDVTGAIRAGAKAAFISRPGMLLGKTAETPDIIAKDLNGLADAMGA